MALVVKDRVKETTTTTGTGAIALGGAVTNFQAFSSVLSDADTTYYAIIDVSNSAFEVGLGTYASSGNTLARTTVLESSNSGSAVDFAAGTKNVFIAYPAEKAVYQQSDGSVLIENFELNANAIKSTDTNGNIQLFPNGTGYTELYGNTNPGAIRFNCEVNTHGVTLKGPAHSAAATYTVNLPDTLGTTNASAVVTSDSDGVVTFADGISEKLETLSGTTPTIDLHTSTNFTHTLSGNTTYTFSNPAATNSVSAFTLKVVQDASASGYTVTWPATVDWPNATAPTLTATANAVDIFVFITIDNGTTYYGFTAGQALG